MQRVRRKGVRELLSPLPIGDTDEGIVRHRVVDTCRCQRVCQPTVAIAVALQPEGTPRGHAQVDEPEGFVHPVEIVVQALARGVAQKGLMTWFVVPGFVGVAGFHSGEHMHQSRMIPTVLEHRGNQIFLADVRLGHVLDSRSLRGRQRLCGFTNAVTQRFGKARVVKNSNVPGIEKTRHPRRVARAGQRPRNHDPVVAGERSGKPLVISIRQHLCHGRLRLLAKAMTKTFTCLVPASPA
jgi:hypothetical protein